MGYGAAQGGDGEKELSFWAGLKGGDGFVH